MSRVHLVEHHHSYRVRDAARGVYETVAWVFGRKTLPKLVGAQVCLHERQADPSYLGGIVLGWRELPRTGRFRRYALIFIQDARAIGVLAGAGGWRNERKTVL